MVIPSTILSFGAGPESGALADVLAACVNSRGGSVGDGSACGQLLAALEAPDGSAPANTAEAMLEIAKNRRNIAELFDLCPSGPSAAVVQPILAEALADWTLEIAATAEAPTFSPAPNIYWGAAGEPGRQHLRSRDLLHRRRLRSLRRMDAIC